MEIADVAKLKRGQWVLVEGDDGGTEWYLIRSVLCAHGCVKVMDPFDSRTHTLEFPAARVAIAGPMVNRPEKYRAANLDEVLG